MVAIEFKEGERISKAAIMSKLADVKGLDHPYILLDHSLFPKCAAFTHPEHRGIVYRTEYDSGRTIYRTKSFFKGLLCH